MIKLYICCLVLIIGSVEVGPDIDMKFHQEVMEIVSYDTKRTDVDEHIDLINTLGDMVDQKEEAKKEKFIENIPTMIQTNLIICKDCAYVKDKTKSLKHII